MNKRAKFIKELERRNVFKVAVAYIVSSWLVAQVADLVMDSFHAPEWSMRALLIALAVGFPIALLISWTFEVTSKGVTPESEIDRTISITDHSGTRLDRIIISILAVVIIFMGLERFVFSGHTGNQISLDTVSDTPLQETKSVASVPAMVDPNSVAVLPFAVLSTGPDDDYFADGLTEEIINALSQLPELMVTARTSAFHFKDQNMPIGDIAGQLGVAHIVEGSVRRAGEQLRITAQLARAADGFHLWSESYDRHTEDTFAVQQDIAEKIATALDLILDEDQRAQMQHVGIRNVDAFTAYQKGIEFSVRAHQSGTDISLLRQGNTLFEEAFTLVPEFSRAYIEHSDLYSHILLSNASGSLDGNITEADVEVAPQALRLDYDRAVASARDNSQRMIFESDRALNLGEWRGLKTISERALRAPGCEVALWAHLASAPFDNAQLMYDAFARMAICDPLEVRAQVHTARALLWLGQPQLALEAAQNSLQTEDHHWLIWVEVLALAIQGEFEAAEQSINTRPFANDERLYALSMLAAIRGDLDLAAQYHHQYLQLHGSDDQSSLVMEAARGNRAEANRLAALIDSRPFGFMSLMHSIYLCTCGAPFDLEATPVFAGMLAESGLPWPPLKPIDFPLKDW